MDGEDTLVFALCPRPPARRPTPLDQWGRAKLGRTGRLRGRIPKAIGEEGDTPCATVVQAAYILVLHCAEGDKEDEDEG